MQLFFAVLLGVISRPTIANAQLEIEAVVVPARAAIDLSDFKRFLLISKEVITAFRATYPSPDVRQESIQKALIKALRELNLLLNSGAFKELSLEQQRRVIGEFFGAPEDQTLPKVRRIRVFEIHQSMDGMDDFSELGERFRRVNAKSENAKRALNQAVRFRSVQNDIRSFAAAFDLLPIQDLSLQDLGFLSVEVTTAQSSASNIVFGQGRATSAEAAQLKSRLEAALARINNIQCPRISIHN